MNAIPNRSRRVLQIGAAVFPLVAFASSARADIFQWEYINPADPSQGKQQSTTLAPDGAGVDAVPSANLSYRNLTMAYLIGADLTGAFGNFANLTNADLSQANLTSADFWNATLTGADFTDAEVRGADFGNYAGTGTGITLAQLYSTSSYQARDLTGIRLSYNNLSGANFAGQNLTNGSFYVATLTGADFAGAEVRGAGFSAGGTGLTMAQLSSTASYQAHDLTRIGLRGDLTAWNFTGQNFTNASFGQAYVTDSGFTYLTDADFTGANVRGVNFDAGYHNFFYDNGGRWISIGTGISPAQLYSTASYQAHDLSGISLRGNHLSGANFAGQNLTNADFWAATLTDANFTGAEVRGVSFKIFAWYICDLGCGAVPTGTGISLAQLYSTASYQIGDLNGINFELNDLAGGNFAGQNLANADFSRATLTGADFTGADARGAFLVSEDAITSNLIRPDGHIDGLNLDADGLLVVRDYDGDFQYGLALPPIPIIVDQHLVMGPGGTLRMVFEADDWDSTISFAPGIPVTLGGMLELTFADDVAAGSTTWGVTDLPHTLRQRNPSAGHGE